MKKFLKLLALGLVTMTSSLLLVACGGISQQTKDSTGGQEVQRPIEKTSCLVTFDSCGGSVVSDQEITRGGKVKKTIPVYSGYDFFGWYTDAQYTKKFDFDSTINQDITLYAKWSNDESELYNFELTNDYSFYGITSYNGESEEITLPRLHNGLRVVSVNSNAFKNNKLLKKVTLPNTIENIYSSAFENCSNLVHVEIPNSVHSISTNAFNRCVKLDNLVIPGSVKTIGDNAFQNCSGLTTLTLKNGIKTISAMAFDGCISLGEVVLPNSVTMVGGMAFRHCDSLTAVTISTGMYEIANAMFQYCGSLESLTLPVNITKIGNSAFSYCYSLEDLQILGNISLFGNSAFYDCQNLKSIYWAANITGNYQSGSDNYIFYNAGKSNNGITLTMAPDAGLPVGVFMPYQNSNIPNITKVVFEDGTTTIDSTEYNRMPYLTSITAPDSVRDITAGIFDNTPWYLAQPNGIICINNIVYGYKGNYASNIIVPDNVVAFGNKVFAGATGITSLTLPFVGRSQDATESNRLLGSLFGTESYSDSTQIEQKYDEDMTVSFYFPQTLRNVTITSETAIPYGAFSGCTNLNTIDLSHCVNLSEVESYAFGGFDNLDNVVFPEQEITLASNAYENMPSSLISIENLNSANGSVQNVQTTTINKSFTLTASANSGFYIVWYDENDDLLKTANAITVTTKPSLTLIKVDFKESDYTISFDSNGGISINDLPVAYNGNFELPIPVRAGYDFAGWYYNNNQIENGIYTYANNINLVAHWNAIFTTQNNGNSCTITGLTDYGKQNYTQVVIPSKIDNCNVAAIGDFAFYNCTNLNQIDLSQCLSLQSIGDYAFYGIESNNISLPVQEIVFGNNVYQNYPNTLVDVEKNIEEAGSITISQTNKVNATSTLSVTVSEGYTFDGWYNDADLLVSSNNPLTITTTLECQTYVAKFHKNEITITFDSDCGITCDNLVVAYGNTMVLPTLIRNGYHFDGWYYNETKVENDVCDFVIDTVLIARWSAIFNVSKSSNKYSITGLTAYGKTNYHDVVIPSMIDNIPVKSIGNSAFSYCKGLTSITIPNSITSIGSYAFNECTNLTSITIPDSVTSIGSSAFLECTKLTSMNYLGTLDKWIQISFSNETSNPTCYTGKIIINGEELTNAVISGSVTSIGSYAFSGCTNLTSIMIPGSVTSVGNSVFNKWMVNQTICCEATTQPSGWNSSWNNGCSANIKWNVSVIDNSGWVYAINNDSISYIVMGYTGAENEIVIPNSYNGKPVTSIGNKAFYRCTGLTSITIPNSVINIGSSAFDGCTNLTSVDYLGTINQWVQISFDGNTSNPTCYAKKLFITGEKVTSAIISDGVANISSYAFYNYTDLTSITIPDSVTSIDAKAFYGCTSLTTVSFGNAVTSIGSSAFSGCIGLSTITLPASVTSIDANAFSGCTSLTTVSLENGVMSIGSYAFSGCKGLTSITIPNSITSIGSYAFNECTNLNLIIIPDNVTSVGSYAFNKWTAKQTIYCEAASKPDGWESSPNGWGSLWAGGSAKIYWNVLTDDNGLLYTINNDGLTYVVAGYIGTEDEVVIPNSYNGKPVTSIGDNAFSGRTGLSSITVPNVITSIGNYAFYKCTDITTISLGNGVTSIGDNAFYECTGLTSITIPNNVTKIGDCAFYSCTSLISISLGNRVNSIGSSAFSGCSSLTSITIPDGVNSISQNTFYNCTNLTSVTIPDSVTSIGNSAFSGCTSLAYIIIPDSVTGMEPFVFNQWTSNQTICCEAAATPGGWYSSWRGDESSARVKWNVSVVDDDGWLYEIKYDGSEYFVVGYIGAERKITIPNSYNGKPVTSIGNNAFSNRTNLTSITIPDSVTSIDDFAFSGCKGLTSITIPNSITSIGNYAFSDCTSLTSITIPASVTTMGYSVFDGWRSVRTIYIKANPSSGWDSNWRTGCSAKVQFN